MNINRLNTTDADFDSQLDALLAWDTADDAGDGIEETVRNILQDVRKNGDAAVLNYTRQFDHLEAADISRLELSPDELMAAASRVADHDLSALRKAAERITEYHKHQREADWSFTDALGNELGQRISPLEKVGVYVPGGQASYPSSVLMTLLPAKVAGVDELIVTVPTPDGNRNDMVLAALSIAGADRVFTVGGAQAVGALAYGTQTIPRVDKIVGPGGAFVAEAKRQVYGHVGIDIIAGPSEILIVADGTTNPEWCALDLFSQAEHDAAAQSLLISPQREFLDAVLAEMERLLPQQPRRETIGASLAGRGGLIQVRDMPEALRIANRVAPEHLELHVEDADRWLSDVRHAGAIFCGPYAGETLGDYAAGPSHVLPTFGTARFGSPLGVYDFVKRSSVIRISAEGAAHLADIAVPMANSEGLHAHAQAAAVRGADQNV